MDTSRFDRQHRRVSRFISAVTVFIILFWITMIGGAIWLADEIGDHGLKSVVERIWYGPEKDDESD